MVAVLPPIPNGTCINDIVTDMADAMLSTAAELASHFKRPRGAQGWCAGLGVEAEMNEAWQQREEARRPLCTEPHNRHLRKAIKMAGKNIRRVCNATVLRVFCPFVRKLETRVREGDQVGFYKQHLKTMKNMEGKRDRSSTSIEDEDSIRLRGIELIHERWVRWFHALLNTKSP